MIKLKQFKKCLRIIWHMEQIRMMQTMINQLSLMILQEIIQFLDLKLIRLLLLQLILSIMLYLIIFQCGFQVLMMELVEVFILIIMMILGHGLTIGVLGLEQENLLAMKLPSLSTLTMVGMMRER